MPVCYETKALFKNLLLGLLFALVIYIAWCCVSTGYSDSAPCLHQQPETGGGSGGPQLLDIYVQSDFQVRPPYKKQNRNESRRVSQEEKENNLYNKLLADGGDKDVEKLGEDEYTVLAKDSESTKSQINRSALATENCLPEGMYSPTDDIERGMMKRPLRKSI
jgi:hypothetical protein